MLRAPKSFGEARLVEIRDSNELETWLGTQPREVSVAFAARAALRVLPMVQTENREGYRRSIVLPPAHAMEIAIAAAVATARAASASLAAARAAAVDAVANAARALVGLNVSNLGTNFGFFSYGTRLLVRRFRRRDAYREGRSGLSHRERYALA